MRIYEKQYVDISGKKYNDLTAVCYLRTIKNRAIWKFRCDCGKLKEIDGKSVRNGNTKSCGCRKLIHSPKDLLGVRFGYLIATKCIGQFDNQKQYWWECKCDCGNVVKAKSALLTAGRVKSCGCLVTEVVTAMNKYRKGPNHPCWRHDISAEEKLKRKTERKCSDTKLNRWRKKVYERDAHTCKRCGDNKGGNLVAHHIYSWAYYEKLRYVTNNGITLCEDCHKTFHNRFGRKKNTKKQLMEFMKI